MNWLYFFLRSKIADGSVLQRSGNGFVGTTPSALVASAAPSANFVPGATAAYDLGITGTRWRRAYLSGGITITAAGTIILGANTLAGTVADKLNPVHLAHAAQVTGDLLVADSATSMARLAAVAVGQVLVSGGVGALPAYSATPNIAHVRDLVGGAGWSTSSTPSAVNGLVLENSATGVYVSVVPGAPAGADANIDVRYRARGTGAGQLVNPANTLIRFEWGATGIGFFGAAQAAQPAAIVDIGAFTDPPSAAEMAALRTAVNSTLAALRTLGVIAT